LAKEICAFKSFSWCRQKKKIENLHFEFKKNVGFFENIFDPFLSLEIKKIGGPPGIPISNKKASYRRL
jgi:hypothetical protein